MRSPCACSWLANKGPLPACSSLVAVEVHGQGAADAKDGARGSQGGRSAAVEGGNITRHGGRQIHEQEAPRAAGSEKDAAQGLLQPRTATKGGCLAQPATDAGPVQHISKSEAQGFDGAVRTRYNTCADACLAVA